MLQGVNNVWVHGIVFLYYLLMPQVDILMPQSERLGTGLLKYSQKDYSVTVTAVNHLKERSISQCAENDGNLHLFNRVHLNLASSIELCVANDGNLIEHIIS